MAKKNGVKENLMSTDLAKHDNWSSGDSYERYVGRWSRAVAKPFIHWLAIPDDSQWLDVGCGTGALSQTILESTNPKNVTGVDRSEDFVEKARTRLNYPNARFETGNAQFLSVESDRFDAVVSGLVLNFVPKPEEMVNEMKRAARTDGTIALYVWDYAGKMQFMRHFWNAATALDISARDLDEGNRFPLCSPGALTDLFAAAKLTDIETRAIDIATDFRDFDDFWAPFLGGQGSAPGYAMSLSEEHRAKLRDRIYNSLPFALDGSIPLVARAWAVKGVK